MSVADVIRGDAVADRPAASVACAHCGLDVPSGLIDANESTQFCCGGCRAAYAILHEHGLERYYDFAERRGAPVTASTGATCEMQPTTVVLGPSGSQERVDEAAWGRADGASDGRTSSDGNCR